MSTKAERDHMAKIADMPCVVCFCSPVEVHHALTGGGGRKKWWGLFGHERDLLQKVGVA